MSDDPKDEDRGADNWGIGQMADGSINVVPAAELEQSIAQTNADQDAFGALLEDEPVDDDLSDLEDELP